MSKDDFLEHPGNQPDDKRPEEKTPSSFDRAVQNVPSPGETDPSRDTVHRGLHVQQATPAEQMVPTKPGRPRSIATETSTPETNKLPASS